MDDQLIARALDSASTLRKKKSTWKSFASGNFFLEKKRKHSHDPMSNSKYNIKIKLLSEVGMLPLVINKNERKVRGRHKALFLRYHFHVLSPIESQLHSLWIQFNGFQETRCRRILRCYCNFLLWYPGILKGQKRIETLTDLMRTREQGNTWSRSQ